MNKDKYIIYKIILIISSFIILIISLLLIPHSNQNENITIIDIKNSHVISKIPNIFDETTNCIKVYNTKIDLQNLIIKENETYQITDFIENINDLPKEINYYYKNEEMNNYKLPGTYKINIIFKDKINNSLEKEISLQIEEEPKKQEEINISNNNPSPEKEESKEKTTINNLSFEEQILNDNKKLGDSGRIYFSSFYSVALYTPTTTEEAQKYVDNLDSGSMFQYGNVDLIADHAYQGFDIIKKQNVGNYIYIKRKDSKGNITLNKYIVNLKTTGYNTKYQIITKDGFDVAKDNENDIAVYTCNTSDGKNITILLLKQIN